jgi:hypothetical protein
MRRALPLVLVLISLACDKEPAAGGRTGPKVTPPKPPDTLPTTGNPQIRGAREVIVEEIEKAEKELEGGTKPPEHLVANWKKGVDNLIVAARLAVKSEAEEMVRRDLASLRQRQAVLDKSRNDLAEGIFEIQRYLDTIQSGGGKPPEGFTQDELKDRLGERQEQMRALDKEEDEIRARMKEDEDLLTQGAPPPRGATLHTNELKALEELKARIEALEKRLK